MLKNWYVMYTCVLLINTLQEEGVKMIFGQTKTIYGTIAVVSADNLGSLALGGFKESCSAARMCRHCMTTKEDSQTKVCRFV